MTYLDTSRVCGAEFTDTICDYDVNGLQHYDSWVFLKVAEYFMRVAPLMDLSLLLL